MNKLFSAAAAFLLAAFINSCAKEDVLSPIVKEDPKLLSINFSEDSVFVNLTVTSARQERIGTISTTAMEGKMPDSLSKRYSLIIRVTGDGARSYTRSEVLATYTDSLGATYSNSTSDTLNKVTLTNVEKKKNGAVVGSFTIRVSNSTKTRSLILNEGKISTAFIE